MGYYQRLKDLREDKDLNQTQIAKVLKTSQKQYSRWETGEYDIPFEIVIELAEFYNVSLDYIAGRTNNKRGIGFADSYKTKIEQHNNEIAIGEININKGGK